MLSRRARLLTTRATRYALVLTRVAKLSQNLRERKAQRSCTSNTVLHAQCSCVFYLSLFSLSTEDPFQKGNARGSMSGRSSLLQLPLLHIQHKKLAFNFACPQYHFDYLSPLNFCHVSLHFKVISAEIP